MLNFAGRKSGIKKDSKFIYTQYEFMCICRLYRYIFLVFRETINEGKPIADRYIACMRADF